VALKRKLSEELFNVYINKRIVNIIREMNFKCLIYEYIKDLDKAKNTIEKRLKKYNIVSNGYTMDMLIIFHKQLICTNCLLLKYID